MDGMNKFTVLEKGYGSAGNKTQNGNIPSPDDVESVDMTKVPEMVQKELNKREQPDRSGILRPAPVITDKQLKEDLKKYDEEKLHKVKNPLSLMGPDGDTEYFETTLREVISANR